MLGPKRRHFITSVSTPASRLARRVIGLDQTLSATQAKQRDKPVCECGSCPPCKRYKKRLAYQREYQAALLVRKKADPNYKPRDSHSRSKREEDQVNVADFKIKMWGAGLKLEHRDMARSYDHYLQAPE